MQTITEHRRAAVREGYQILMRAEVELVLPAEYEKVAEFCRQTADACLNWATEVAGERLRAEYLALPDHRAQSRFRVAQYRFSCLPVWEREGYAAFICRSQMRQSGVPDECRRSAQVWNLNEQSMLPASQILKLVGYRPEKGTRPPFRPEGVCPWGDELVFFRTSGQGNDVPEFRVPIGKKENTQQKK